MDETTVVLYGPWGLRRAAALVVGATLGCAAAVATFPLVKRLAAPGHEPAELRDAVADRGASADGYALEALSRLSARDPVAALSLSARALALDRSDETALAALKLAERQLGLQGAAKSARSSGPWTLLVSPATGAAAALAFTMLIGAWRRRRAPAAAPIPAPVPPSAPPGGLHAPPEGYEFVRVIGEGGMGIVYEAQDKRLGRRVALKRMRDEIRRDRRERDRFLQEARLVASLHHPSIVDIHTIVEDDENVWLVFEYVSGKTVENLLAEKRCLPLAEAKRILRAACEALEFAHRHGVVHRDLKPSNIMVSDEGEVKVMDFGVARRAKESLSRLTTQTIAGTPLYMAPEAEDGVVRRESDVYALGACLYEMVTGEGVFAAPTTRAAKMCRRYVPPSRQREGVPQAVDMIVDWALQPDPEKRIPTARDFAARLEEIA